MEVTIYGLDININTESQYGDLGEILDTIADEGGIVIKLLADKVDITEFSAGQLEAIKPISHLEIEVKSKEEFLKESLDEADRYLVRLISGIDEVIEYFTKGIEGEAFSLLGQALEGIQWLTNLFVTLEYNLNLDNFDSIKKDEFINNWTISIEELGDALENQDSILLSDILEYELIPSLEKYLNFVREIKNDFN